MIIQFGLKVHLTSLNHNVSKFNHLNLEWALASGSQRPMDPVTNTFCAVGFSIT